MKEYKTLIMKMNYDVVYLANTRSKLSKTLVIQTLLTLPCIKFLPFLRFINNLMKFAQPRDVYIVDCFVGVKSCAGEFPSYFDEETSFKVDNFHKFFELIDNYTCPITIEWVMDLNDHETYLSFRIGDHSYPSHHLALLPSKRCHSTKQVG